MAPAMARCTKASGTAARYRMIEIVPFAVAPQDHRDFVRHALLRNDRHLDNRRLHKQQHCAVFVTSGAGRGGGAGGAPAEPPPPPRGHFVSALSTDPTKIAAFTCRSFESQPTVTPPASFPSPLRRK